MYAYWMKKINISITAEDIMKYEKEKREKRNAKNKR